MTYVYITELQNLYPEQVDYFNCISNLFGYLSFKYQQELMTGTLLTQLMDKCIRFSEANMQNTPQVRISAISLLTEIWHNFAAFIDR